MSNGVSVYEAVGSGEDFIFRDFNPAAEKIERLSAKEVLGRRVSEVFPGVKEFGIFEVFKRVWQTGKPEYFPLNVYKDDRTLESWRENWVFKLPAGEIVAIFNDVTARVAAEKELQFSNILLENQADTSIEGILVVDETGKIISFNKRFVDLWGIPSEVIASRSDELALKSVLNKLVNPDEFLARVRHLYAHREEKSREEVALLDRRTFDRYSAPMFGKDGTYYGRVWYFRDITDLKSAEKEREKVLSQLQQSQKMESVGRLAGGVAHDFNNLLTAINGYAGFLLSGLPEKDPRRADVKEIIDAAQRATTLTRQLLAFSRKQILNPRVIDLNSSVGGVVKILKRLIGEDVRLETRLAARPCTVKVDVGQIDQVLINLAVNARDAMPMGGTLTLETETLSPEADFFERHPDLKRGPLVCLSIRDTGSGMTAEIKEHLFEPFFTTKVKGKGTGLGLSTVFGIIKQSGGDIEIESEPDHGTVFRVYFPFLEAVPKNGEKDKNGDKKKDAGTVLRGSETVLLVEDEDSLRRLGERLLRMSGYTVIAAADGPSALAAAERHGKPFDLLVTDVIMPGMSGKELAVELVRRKLARKTLFMSGYTDDAIVQHGVLEPGIAFLYKPFTADALAVKLREVLDGPADQG